MYSGKIAVPPGGGGIVESFENASNKNLNISVERLTNIHDFTKLEMQLLLLGLKSKKAIRVQNGSVYLIIINEQTKLELQFFVHNNGHDVLP
jgi:hypothetical protein